jgi:hypothetical protein
MQMTTARPDIGPFAHSGLHGKQQLIEVVFIGESNHRREFAARADFNQPRKAFVQLLEDISNSVNFGEIWFQFGICTPFRQRRFCVTHAITPQSQFIN